MNIIATYHPVNKDYGHMKIEEPKTPYASGTNEEMDTEYNNDETASEGIDPDVLVHRFLFLFFEIINCIYL
jgi:protein phosphatase inhibitor 2